MKKVCGVYSITCLSNGKQYIGSSINIQERWYKHRRALRKNIHENANIQNSWNKYGEGQFEFKVLEETAPETRVDHERDICRSLNPVFNNKIPDKNTQHWHHGEKSKAKIAEIVKRAWENPETRAKMVASAKQRWQDPNEVERLSSARKRYLSDPENRKRMGLSVKKGMDNPVTRKKMSDAKLGTKQSMDARIKRGKSLRMFHKNKDLKILDGLGITQTSMPLELDND